MKVCRVCLTQKEITQFVKTKAHVSGYDSICLVCNHIKVKEWRASGKRDAKKEEARRKEKNPEKHFSSIRIRSKKYYDLHRRKPRVLKTPAERRAMKAMHESKRRANKKCMLWEQELTTLVVKEAHHLCNLREQATRTKWHVDHIIPLNGKIVSGLHIWNNIQVLPASINIKKSNKYAA